MHYDSPGRDNRAIRSLNREWVEVTNNSYQDVNLEDEDGHTYTFHPYRLEGRSTVRIHTGQGRDSHTDLYQDRHQYVWDNGHDSATLCNDHGRFVFVDDYSLGL